MVGPSPQDIQPQANHGQPNTFGSASYPQQQPYQQPTAIGAAYTAPQPYPPPQAMGPQGNLKNNKTIVSIGNFSLFAIIFSLIFFGTFTFLGGFLLGMWLETPTTPSYVIAQNNSPPASSLFPPTSSRPQKETVENTQNASQQTGIADILGETASDAVSEIKPPDTPDFLTPLIREAQDAAAKQAADKTQKAAEQTQRVIEPSTQPSVSPQPQTLSSPQSSSPQQRHGLLPTQTLEGGAPTPSSTSAQPLSQEEGAYSVQLGVYAAQENAEALKNKLQALNYTTYVTPGKSTDGNVLYYVHSGSYKNYATASEVASQFTSRNIPGAVVVKISKNGNDAS